MTASRGWWVHGALARLQVLLGGMVICHIRFSTTPDTMVVVYIGLRFFPYEIAFHHFAMEHAFLVRPYLPALPLNLRPTVRSDGARVGSKPTGQSFGI